MTITTPSTELAAARMVDGVKVYGEGLTEVTALRGVSAEFSRGQFTAIMGPSGSGKSTLLHCLAGLDTLTSGSVFVGDVELGSLKDKALTELRRDRIGFIFQSYNLIPTLNAQENIVLPLSIAGRKPEREWMGKVISALGLGDRLHHRPTELSGGQQQRVAAARALVSRPQIVFADEPSGNLDSKAGGELLDFMQRAVREFDQTIVMVTHDPISASYAERILFLDDGAIVDTMADPTPERVLDRMKKLRSLTVLRAAIKSLLAHKARLVLTAVSIVLGVAFVSGTYIYTDTTNQAFDEVFSTVYEGVDVVVTGSTEFTFGQGVFFDESIADEVAGVDGVATVEPSLTVPGVQVIGADGEPIGGGGPPQFGASIPAADEQVATSFVLREGRAPEGDGEVVVDASTARIGGFEIGDQVSIVSTTAAAKEYELVGVIGFGDADNLAGATVAGFDLATIQAVAGREGTLSDLNVAVDEGVDVDEVVSAIQAILPENVVAKSAQSAAEEQAGEIQDQLGFFTNFLLVFAFVALFVGSFIIYNTFRIVVTQRMRELALMRAIGSTRSQVVRAVLLEAVLVGLVSSLIGIAAGFGLAVALRAILDAVGLDLPSGSLVLLPRTVIAGLLVGVVVTAASALLPAIAASRIPPVAAMRADEVTPGRRSMRVRAIVGTLMLVAGGLLIFGGLNNDSGNTTVILSSVGAGALVMILGAYALSALVARPVADVIGAPFARFFGVSGRLAQRNAGRSPRRTSATAAAIMVGIALITLASIMSASIQATVDEVFATGVDAEVVVTSPFTSTGGFSPELAERASALPEVAAVTRVPQGSVLLDGTETFISALDANFADFFAIDHVDGSLDLGAGDLLVDEATAEAQGWAVGDPVELTFEETGPQQFTVSAIVKSDAISGLVITRDDFDANFAVDADSQVYIQLVEGVTPEEGRDAVAAVATDIPTANVQTNEEFTDSIADQVNSLLGLITGLLGMTVLVALIGVTNTMALAVFERTREIGLLRAVGLNRAQTRRMIRFEASIISTFGALLGVVLGIFFGWAIIQALSDQGFSTFVIPWVALAIWVLSTAVLGVLFAIWPARRASKLNVLEAISHE